MLRCSELVGTPPLGRTSQLEVDAWEGSTNISGHSAVVASDGTAYVYGGTRTQSGVVSGAVRRVPIDGRVRWVQPSPGPEQLQCAVAAWSFPCACVAVGRPLRPARCSFRLLRVAQLCELEAEREDGMAAVGLYWWWW